MVTSSLHHSGERVWLDEEVEKVLLRKKDIETLEKVSRKADAHSAKIKKYTQYIQMYTIFDYTGMDV